MSNINILVEAKKEYTNQLQKLLRPRIYEGFKSIYEDIINIGYKELEENKIQTSSLIKTFQKMLKEVPQWNQEMINNEYNRILKISNCDYFENLIEAVFIANIKILTSVQINNNSKNININIPQSSHFMHKCYIKSANEIYKNPYIFDNSKNLTPKEKHNNLREVLLLIDNSINNAISDLLPIGDILKQGLTKNNKEFFKEDLNKYSNKNIKRKNEEDNTQEDNSLELNSIENNSEEDNSIENNSVEDNPKINKEDNQEEFNKEDNQEEFNQEDNQEDNQEEFNKEFNQEDNQEEFNQEDNQEEDNQEEFQEEDNQEDIQEEDNQEDIQEDIQEDYKNINQEIIIEKNIINLNNLTNNQNKNEIKEIIYNKVTPPFVNKIKNIEKINIVPIIEKKQKEETKTNPFIKNIKSKKFIKNKFYGGQDKNNTFYKKKYEENSANYHSISEKNDIKTTIENNSKTSIKLTKNKIMLDEISSDEESNIDIEI